MAVYPAPQPRVALAQMNMFRHTMET